MASLNPYGKVHEADQERLTARRKTKKRIAIIGISSIVLVVVVAAAVVGATQTKNSKEKGQVQSISSEIKSICSVTLYPDSCYNSLIPHVKSGNLKPQDILKMSVQVALNEISKTCQDFEENGGLFKNFNITDKMTLEAIQSCQELLSLAIDHLNNSLSLTDDNKSLSEIFYDLRTWLSSSGTYQQTCIDGFENASSGLSKFVVENLKNSTEFTSNSLAMVTELESSMESITNLGGIGRRRRLMMRSFHDDEEAEPRWLDRKLVENNKNWKIKADVIVAKDGSGKYKTIKEALKNVPENSDKIFVIYVKKGIYFENVRIEKKMWNVMMIGDGKNATIVSAALNVVDGTPTFQTATFGT